MAGDSRSQRQLTLDVQLGDEATFDNFLVIRGTGPLQGSLRAQLSPSGEPLIFLCGPRGAGKSHLLQAACHQAGAGALYLPLADMRHYDPGEVLQGVDALELVCLDDLQAVLGDEAWELALFDFYNRARESGSRLLLAASAAPRMLELGLEDLRSRLGWGVVYQLPAADDADKAAILRFRASRRGLNMPPEVANYIVSRSPRALEHLLGQLDALDRASLAEQRSLSIPFVKEVLGL